MFDVLMAFSWWRSYVRIVGWCEDFSAVSNVHCVSCISCSYSLLAVCWEMASAFSILVTHPPSLLTGKLLSY